MMERAQKERLGGRIYWVGAAMFVALLSIEVYKIRFSYQDHKTAVISILRLQAEAVADKSGAYIAAITSQVGWTVQLPWSRDTLGQRRFDAERLLRQVPAITELVQFDSTGKEQFRVGRLAIIPGPDYRDEFAEAVVGKVHYGPVYFRSESEPYMTLSLAGTGLDTGVSVAEVNLRFIWDLVSQIKIGQRGQAYVIGAEGRLIAHPDISLVLRNTDMTRLPQVAAARAAVSAGAGAGPDSGVERVQVAKDVQGREVLTAYAPIAPLGWLVFVELPVEEAYAPLYAAIERSFGLLLAVMLAFFGVAWFSRRSRRWASRKVAGPSEVIE